MMDGGKDGPVTELLWRKVNEATDAELRGQDIRLGVLKQYAQDNGITPAVLAKQITVDGLTYTTDEVIHMHMAMQNEDAAMHLVYGNKVAEETAWTFISKLTPEQRAYGDFLMTLFSQDNFDKISQVVIDLENRVPERVQKYFPIYAQDVVYDNMRQQIMEDMLNRTNVKRAYVQKGFTKSRIKISAEHQVPMKLGATNIAIDSIQKQEKFISSATLVRDLQQVFGNRRVQEAVTQKYGTDYNKHIQKYINDFANPNIYATLDGASHMSRTLRKNAQVAYLAFNVITVAKQLPSFLFYLADAGPFHLMSGMTQMLFHPKETVDFVYQRDPQVKHRSIDRALEEIKQADKGLYSKIIQKVGQIGMWPIALMDKVAVVSGWKAVYDKAISNGMSEQEAIQAAQESTLRTQPAARAKDLAAIYRSSEGLNWFLMFTNQLNQIWNMVSYDLPLAVKQNRIAYASSLMASLLMSGVAMGFIARKRIPQTPQEWAQDTLNQFISANPVRWRQDHGRVARV